MAPVQSSEQLQLTKSHINHLWILRHDVALGHPEYGEIILRTSGGDYDTPYGHIVDADSDSDLVEVRIWNVSRYNTFNICLPVRYIAVGDHIFDETKPYDLEGRDLDDAIHRADILAAHISASGDTPLAKAVNALIEVIGNKGMDAGLELSDGQWDFFKTDAANLEAQTDLIVAGTEAAGQLGTFNKPGFQFSDFIHDETIYLSESPDSDCAGKGGIYARFYENRRGDWDAIVGSTRDFTMRHSNWLIEMETGRSLHSRIALKAKRSMHVVLCVLGQQHTGHRVDNKTIEQLFILLLETYRPSILRTTISVDADNKPIARLSDGPGIGQHIQMIRTARILDQLATRAKAASNWPGFTRRLDKFMGLNFSSPLTETQFAESMIWFRTDAWIENPEDMDGPKIKVAQFRRAKPVKCRAMYEGLVVFGIQYGWGSGTVRRKAAVFMLPLNIQPRPRLGTLVDVSFEVRLDGEQHPFAWARLPQIGPFTDWGRANSIALRIEWPDEQDPTKWYQYYLQAQTVNNAVSANQRDNNGGWNSHYASAIGLIKYFLREPIDPVRSWSCNYGYANVKKVAYNHINRSIDYHAMDPSGAVIQSRQKTPQKMAEEITAAGLKNAGGERREFEEWDVKNPDYRLAKPNSRRTRCDTCFARNCACVDVDDNPAIGYENGCKACYQVYARPCSWTAGLTPFHQADNSGCKKMVVELLVGKSFNHGNLKEFRRDAPTVMDDDEDDEDEFDNDAIDDDATEADN